MKRSEKLLTLINLLESFPDHKIQTAITRLNLVCNSSENMSQYSSVNKFINDLEMIKLFLTKNSMNIDQEVANFLLNLVSELRDKIFVEGTNQEIDTLLNSIEGLLDSEEP